MWANKQFLERIATVISKILLKPKIMMYYLLTATNKKVIIKLMTLFLAIFVSIDLEAQTYTLSEEWIDCGNSCQLQDPYYFEGTTYKWSGGCKEGKAHGIGKVERYMDGKLISTYDGEYKNGVREGHGRITYSSGTVKEGSFVNGQMIGEGTLTTEDGHFYSGHFVNNRMHGVGKLKMANGSTFEGWFVAGDPYTGKWINYDGTVIYLEKGERVEKLSISKKSTYKPKIGARVTEYFDEDWNRCQAKGASYYRLITYASPNTPKGIVKDYYINGKIQGSFYAAYIDYEDDGKTFHEGEANWYWQNGQLQRKCYYYNNELNGPNTYYYENGNVHASYFYDMGVIDGSAIENYENGKPQTIANYDQGVLKNNKYLQITEEGACFLVYNENFVKNKKYWEYKGANGILKVNPDNTISLKITPGRSVSGGIYADFSPKGEHIISILTHRKAKDENIIGLLFGFKDWENYCGLYISGNKYVFQYIKNGRKMTAQEWKSSPTINAEVNKLTILSTSSKTSLIINNETVEEYDRIDYAGAFCCVTGVNESNEECYFDAAELSVSEYVDPKDIPSEYLPKKVSGDSWTASGSGFFLSEDGYVATNHHVIEGAKVIEISIVRDGKWEHHPAKVVLSDKENDLSILKIEDASFKNLPPIPYNFTTRIQDTGSEVFTLGYPIAEIMGDEVKFTDGKISSKSGIHGDATVYQISVPIQPGNSGGPLFDIKGNLVGITSSCLNRDYFKSENVNYAIKSSYLKALVDRLPRTIRLQDKADIADYPLTEKIKKFQSYMTYIKVK